MSSLSYCRSQLVMNLRSAFDGERNASAGWGRYQTRGLSFANYDESSLPRESMGARIGLGSAPSGECPDNMII